MRLNCTKHEVVYNKPTLHLDLTRYSYIYRIFNSCPSPARELIIVPKKP